MGSQCVRPGLIAALLVLIPVLIPILAALAACTAPPPPDDTPSYTRELAAARSAKDAALGDGSDSPIPRSRRAELLPLAYFPIDLSYRVPAVLRVDQARTPVEMPTSTGPLRKMEIVGTLEFSLKGQSMSLRGFVEAGQPPDRLFVPFSDLTSGAETYPAGRYLDLDRTATGIYTIDFNRAYHPYCYYNPTYECPLPPRENRLPVPVRAGERMKE